MRNRKSTPHLGVSREHRRALVRNLLTSLVLEDKVETTLVQARELARQADRLVARTRRILRRETAGNREAIRYAAKFLTTEAAQKKLFAEIIPRAEHRVSGFVRRVRVRMRQTDRAVIIRVWWTDAVMKAAPAVEIRDAEVTEKKVHHKADGTNPAAQHEMKGAKAAKTAPKSAAKVQHIQEPGGKAQGK